MGFNIESVCTRSSPLCPYERDPCISNVEVIVDSLTTETMEAFAFLVLLAIRYLPAVFPEDGLAVWIIELTPSIHFSNWFSPERKSPYTLSILLPSTASLWTSALIFEGDTLIIVEPMNPEPPVTRVLPGTESKLTLIQITSRPESGTIFRCVNRGCCSLINTN